MRRARSSPPLLDRQKKLAMFLKAHPAGVKAGDIMAELKEYQSPEASDDAVRQMLLRDLNKLKSLKLATNEEGRRRHTLWWPGEKKSVELMNPDSAVAITALSLFSDLPLDRTTSRRIDELVSDARLCLEQAGKHYARLKDKIAFKPWVARRRKPPIASEIFETLLDATLREQNIDFGYKTTKGKTTVKHGVSPLGLMIHRDIVYLVFHEGDGRPPIQWPLHRFEWVQVAANSPFRSPGGWSLAQHARTVSMIPDGGIKDAMRVVLRFNNENAVRNLRDAPFEDCHQRVEPDPGNPGKFLFSADLVPNRELLTWVMYFGKNVEILEPESLREMMRKEVNEMVAFYNLPQNHP